MKKVYISIASLLLCGSMLMAQSPANRTSKTIVADVLASYMNRRLMSLPANHPHSCKLNC